MSTDRIALVTGASRGIGAAIAEALIDDGHFVIGTATAKDGAAQITEHLDDRGVGFVMRVDDSKSVEGALNEVQEAYAPISILVNNAGVTRDSLLMRMKESEWYEVINTNLSSLHRVCKPLIRGMTKQRWGRIINISSVVGRMGNAGQANYSASKAGIEGFTRALAMELSSRGITVNCVAPGFIDTDMTRQLPESQVDTLLSKIPAGRIGAPSDVAGAVSFLASECANYITSQTIHVNGGLFPA